MMDRRLTTIVAADLVAYSRLMAADEEGTIARLRAARGEVVDPAVHTAGGRIIKSMGDGFLIEFPSPVAALRCVMGVQDQMATREDGPEDSRLRFRVGVNLGDVVIDGDDILGDGVNIAARLESLAPAGGICISRAVHDQVRGKVDATLTDLGPQMVKNIPDPVEVWRVEVAGAAPAAPKVQTARPSIAVLPFDNLSSDPDQSFLADGIVEDVITELSRFRSLFVIARNSTFAYKGSHKDVREIARDLNVAYVVEGSVRRAGNRLRVTAQLIEAESGRHLWAERWDRTLEDLFDLQDELTRVIVASVEPELGAHKRAIARVKPTGSLTAWELFQRGNGAYLRSTDEGYDQCLDCCTRAIAIDPHFALPYALLGRLYWYRALTNRVANVAAEIETSLAYCRQAIEIDDREELGWVALTCTLSLLGHETEARAALFKAEALNPNNALVLLARCVFHMFQEDPEVDLMENAALQALRQSPRDPNAWAYQAWVSRALTIRHGGLHAKEVRKAYEATAAYENAEGWAHFTAAICNLAQDRPEQAQRYLTRALQLQPDLTLSKWLATHRILLDETMNARHRDDLENLVELGLPRE